MLIKCKRQTQSILYELSTIARYKKNIRVETYLQQIDKYWTLHCFQQVFPDWIQTVRMSFLYNGNIPQMCNQHVEVQGYFHMEIDYFDCMNNEFDSCP